MLAVTFGNIVPLGSLFTFFTWSDLLGLLARPNALVSAPLLMFTPLLVVLAVGLVGVLLF